MTQPSDPRPPQQWWQPPSNPPGGSPGGPPGPVGGPPEAATGPHSGQWQQTPDPATGSYTGPWQPGQPSGSFSGPWQPGQPWQPPSQPTPQQQPPTPGHGQLQYGGGFQGFQQAQYGGLGAFPAGPEKKPKSKKPALIALAAVLVLALGGGAAWLLGAFRGDVLDQQSLQDGVVKVLNENYGEPDVKNAQCPANEPTQNGTTFDCTVTIGGQQKKVTVRVLNDRPEYEVGAPR
ncbi:DUF4333 domain-containing protein [Amycolatopsis sp. CA-128772]|uniref:DUF4333 domain-containing protein n=1 Tax=Amycolatopsis sp. CA-128772 TaxID=2073159 RepID=UPI000CD2096B|nr:DUF4333 domain-containing protein [Amycolatopsis sp. CA-128772]